MATFNHNHRAVITRGSSIESLVDLRKLSMENAESVSVGVYNPSAAPPYNPLADAVSQEADKPDPDDEGADGKPGEDTKSSSPLSDSTLNMIKNSALKAADFGKSSVGKVNALPKTAVQAQVNQKIMEAKDNPKSIGDMAKKAAISAGKGVAYAGLAAISLPLAAAALIKAKRTDTKTKSMAADSVEGELIRVKQQLANTGDDEPDKKADLLILQRNLEKALMKLKYNIKTNINRRED